MIGTLLLAVVGVLVLVVVATAVGGALIFDGKGWPSAVAGALVLLAAGVAAGAWWVWITPA